MITADCVRAAARKVTRRARCPDYYCYSETVFEHSERPGQHHTHRPSQRWGDR